MNVLHVLDHTVPYFSGYSFRTRYILETQQKLGLQPTALTSPKHENIQAMQEEIYGVRHYRTKLAPEPVAALVERIPFIKERVLMRTLRARILEVAAREHIDLIHAHSPILDGIPALKAARKLQVPIVYEVRAFWEDAAVDHGTLKENSFKYNLIRKLETDLLRKVDAVITICEGLKQDIVKRGIAEDKITVITNCVDVSYFLPLERDKELEAKYQLAGKTTLGFIGSFYRYEGLDLLLEAFHKLVPEHPDLRLLLVGEGELMADLHARTEKYALGERVILTGNVPHEQVRRYYSLIDLAVYPRKRMRLTETVTPLKTLEAMSMEKLVVCSDLAAFRELIAEDRTGLLFRAGDAEDLADKCRRVLRQPEVGKKIGSAARQSMLETREWKKVIGKELELYKKLSANNAHVR
jgi:PEP-CTERM/exosortase A-associated glycosyltransferase